MDETIDIPFTSYTASRLTYAKPKILHKNGKVVLLGKVPAIWMIDDSPGLLKRSLNRTKKKLRDSTQVGSVISNAVKSTLFDDNHQTFKPTKPYPKAVSLLEAVNKYMLENDSEEWDDDEDQAMSEDGEDDDVIGNDIEHDIENEHENGNGNVNIYNGNDENDSKSRPNRQISFADGLETSADMNSRRGSNPPNIEVTLPDEEKHTDNNDDDNNYDDNNVDLLLKEYIDTINEKIMERRKIDVPTVLPDLFKDDEENKLDIDGENFPQATINASPITNLEEDGGESTVRSVSTIVNDAKSDEYVNKGDTMGSGSSATDTSMNDTIIPNSVTSKDSPQDLNNNDPSSVNSVVFHDPGNNTLNDTDDHSIEKDASKNSVHNEDCTSISSDEEYYTAESDEFSLRSSSMDSTDIVEAKDQTNPAAFSGEPKKSSTNIDADQHTLPSKADSGQIYQENNCSSMVPSGLKNSTEDDFAVNNPPQLHPDIEQSNQHNEISPSISPMLSIVSEIESPTDVNTSTPENLTGDSQDLSDEPRFLTSASKEAQDIPLSQQSSAISAAVKWDSSLSKRNRKSIINVAPQPMHRIDDVNPIQERDARVVDRLKKVAGKSKSKYIDTRNNYRDKMFGMAMRNYQPGQIIRTCEMLVMIKSIKCSSVIRSFTENEYCDSRIIDRWKEYQVVMRMTENIYNPITIELYCTRSIFNNKKDEASYSFDINSQIYAQFYSDTDKTISIVVPPEEGESKVFILRTHNQVAAFRWLFIVKSAQRFNFGNVLSINVPKLSISLQVEFPNEVIYNLLHWRNSAKIHTLTTGYRMEYSPLLEYLREYIEKELAVRHNKVLSDFSRFYEQPWFCYKRYDSLEWVQNDSESFFIQNLLLGHEYSLEIRDMGHYPSNVKIDDEIIEEPVPIEGFLSRLTNISGKEKSFFRSFYKMSYCFTSKNLLFYTTYYKAMPPSPQNNFITDTNVSQTANGLPQVFECSTFPISKNDHIYWLHGDEFEHYDKIAQGEFTRKVEQIVKAKGFIDMARIKEIKVIPFKSITPSQKLLHCTYWYSNPDLMDDKTLVDSGFELIMQNGSRVKLLAPNTNIRDEWIQRLNELRSYWKFRKQKDVISRIKLKDYNQKALNISEFQDANVSHQVELNEIFKSEADISLDNIDSMALLTCILNHGYLFQKTKKHADFNLCYAILVPGYLILYRTYKRSKVSGRRKKQAIFQHFITIPITNCYVYSGISTELDLLDRREDIDPMYPERHSLPRVYVDGWKSSEEEHMLCFTLWIGKKRNIRGKYKVDNSKPETVKNPGLGKMVAKLGITGKSVVFMARSRQEQATWTQRILYEVDRHAGVDEED